MCQPRQETRTPFIERERERERERRPVACDVCSLVHPCSREDVRATHLPSNCSFHDSLCSYTICSHSQHLSRFIQVPRLRVFTLLSRILSANRTVASGLRRRVPSHHIRRWWLYCPYRVGGVWLITRSCCRSWFICPDVGVEAVLVSSVLDDSEHSVRINV